MSNPAQRRRNDHAHVTVSFGVALLLIAFLLAGTSLQGQESTLQRPAAEVLHGSRLAGSLPAD